MYSIYMLVLCETERYSPNLFFMGVGVDKVKKSVYMSHANYYMLWIHPFCGWRHSSIAYKCVLCGSQCRMSWFQALTGTLANMTFDCAQYSYMSVYNI